MTEAVRTKPTVAALGIDAGAQDWQRSGEGEGAIEIAFVRPGACPGAGAAAAGTAAAVAATAAAGADGVTGAGGPGATWILMRVAGDPDGRVLVYDRNEWECFLDGVRAGEFDDATG
jgi:hypothetical protein